MASISSRRLSKELMEIQNGGCPVGIILENADDFQRWCFSIEVMGESLYQASFQPHPSLSARFDPQYPISSPAVQFVQTEGRQIPIHPHVYSNGHICASILGNEWSPVLSVIAVCVTLQSMLASCREKRRPIDNDRYVKHAPDNPKKTQFHYDDDT
ncbi:UBC-like protein [Marasmius fiardii PR-910]|nr:UBC-like protein [Marasmius fiardii PR-910]